MAAFDVEDGDELTRDESGRFAIVRRHRDGGVTYLPIAFSGLPDYFDWIRRNSRCLPDDFVATAKKVASLYAQGKI